MNRLRLSLFSLVLFACISPLSRAQQSPSTVDDSFHQGLIALQENRLQDALEAFDLAVKAHPNNAGIHNFRGITLMSLGHIDDAAKEYRRATELDSHLEDAYRNLGFLEWNAHSTDSSRRDLKRALYLDPNDAFATYYLARLELETGNSETATSLFKQFADRGLDWARFDLALIYLRLGQHQRALDSAQSVAHDQVSSSIAASTYSIMGIAQSRLDREDQSLADFRKAADLSSQQEEFWLNLTREQMDSKRLNEAIESTQEALKAIPNSYALHLRLGAAYLAAGKYPEAEQSFRDLVSAGDPLPTSSIGLAQVLLRTGHATEAAAELISAERRLGPQFLIVYFEGLALDRAGRRQEAISAFQRAVQADGKSAEAHLGLGKTFLAVGRNNEAVSELETVLKLEPNSVPAHRLLKQAYARAGDRTQADKMPVTAVSTDSVSGPSLVGDFILPDWQQPSTR